MCFASGGSALVAYRYLLAFISARWQVAGARARCRVLMERYRRCGQSQAWTGIRFNVGLQMNERSLSNRWLVWQCHCVAVRSDLAHIYGQDRHTCGFPIDRSNRIELAQHRSKAQFQSSDCRPGDFCTSILRNDCSSGPSWTYISTVETRHSAARGICMWLTFACGCEDWIFYRTEDPFPL